MHRTSETFVQLKRPPKRTTQLGPNEATELHASKATRAVGQNRALRCTNDCDGKYHRLAAFSGMNNYYEGLNEKLLIAIPPSQKVLELGCAAGRLGEKYKQLHPEATWVGVDINPEALQQAARRLDATFQINLDDELLDAVGNGYDCVVMGDLLEHLKQPETLLENLVRITRADASLACCAPNMAHVSVFERMLLGDLYYDDQGLLDRTHLRFLSCSSLFKMLLDAGWLPTLHDSYNVGHAQPALLEKLIEAARLLSVPRSTANRLLSTYQMVLQCKKRSDTASHGVGAAFSIVVPVTNETQLHLNILKSPGLAEVNAQVLLCRGTNSAADAFQWAVGHAVSPWLILCHQDVYFPKGCGRMIARILSEVSESEAPRTILGFAGLTVEQSTNQLQLAKAGLLVDRVNLFDHPESKSAITIDEFAVVLHRNSRYRIDPRLRWHLWATDLCLQAIFDEQKRTRARVLRVPLFHNSLNDGSLPSAFFESARVLAFKYPQLACIPTLCGVLPGLQLMRPGDAPSTSVVPGESAPASDMQSARPIGAPFL
jgi:2-polyprenyl-3-methyl-5-hydroxy-6-metoxy-1,4-benzoquinol methylase